MRVIVLGAGLIGVASAWALWRDGHEVTLVEAGPEPATGTSQANAGLIAASRALPWPAPGVARQLLAAWFGRSAFWRIERFIDAAFWRWAFAFLSHAHAAEYERLARVKLALARRGHEALRRLLAQTRIDCGYHQAGLLYLCRSRASEAEARARGERLQRFGVRLPCVSAQAVVHLEPALARAVSAGQLRAAAYAPEDAQGDARVFTCRLAEWLAARGVQMRWGTPALGVEARGGRITAMVLGDGQRLPCEVVVACLGPFSNAWAARLGLAPLPILPVKGFSITVPVRDPGAAPRLGGLCEDARVAWCPLEQRRKLRLTTGAVFNASGASWRAADFAPLERFAETLWPGLCDWNSPAVERWAGLRPMTPSTLPILARYGFENLWWNTGHGHLGWTLCAASAECLADAIAGRAPASGWAAFEPL
ncbi:MAG: FAD-dependent oxidoreductase [Casimicrobiaceae bacterium]|nr:FAD-dependent oxidoreductase [Casimicrobiaceae bacterium]